MDSLRQKISQLFNKSTPKSVDTQTQIETQSKDTNIEEIEDLPTPELKPIVGDYNYQLEFVNFLDRNAPKGLSKKLMDMLPYLQLSLMAWPAFWIYRGYNWQNRRNTERISVYIQRTYQQAKLMQVAILATGAFAISMARSPIQMQKIELKDNNEST